MNMRSGLFFVMIFLVVACENPTIPVEDVSQDDVEVTGDNPAVNPGVSESEETDTVEFALATGSVEIVEDLHTCPDDNSRNCIKLNIACEEVYNNIDLTLYIAEPSSAYLGTVTFHSGSGGKGFWAPADKPDAQQAMQEVLAAGYRTVEVKWGNDGWLAGSSQYEEGVTKLSCRPATALKWIHDNLYSAPNDTEAFCATGNSGGSVQISEALINYGLDKYLDLVIPTAGPGLGRIDEGCMNPASEYYLIGQTSIFDKSYGYYNIQGPCTLSDEAYLERFVYDSLALGERDFYHPQTMIYNLVGAEDVGTVTNVQSQLVYDRWVADETPYKHREVLEGVGHGVQSSQTGANRIKEIIINSCRQYTPYFKTGPDMNATVLDLKTGCEDPYYYLNGINKHNKLENVILAGHTNVRAEVTNLDNEVLFVVNDFTHSCVNLNDHLEIGNYYLKFYDMDNNGKPVTAEDRNAVLPILF